MNRLVEVRPLARALSWCLSASLVLGLTLSLAACGRSEEHTSELQSH